MAPGRHAPTSRRGALYCVHSSFVPGFRFELVDKVLDGRRRKPPGGAPVPRWTEPDVEDEDLGERREVLSSRVGDWCYFIFGGRFLNFELLHFIMCGF